MNPIELLRNFNKKIQLFCLPHSRSLRRKVSPSEKGRRRRDESEEPSRRDDDGRRREGVQRKLARTGDDQPPLDRQPHQRVQRGHS